MTALAIGAPPRAKTADQLAAEQRDRAAALVRRVDQVVEVCRCAVLCMGFALVLIAG